MTREKEKAQVGVFGIGLAAYWPQFPGLKERLEGYQRKVEQRIGEWATVISGGLVDDPAAAKQAGDVFAGAGVDLVFCYVGTYATSSQVLPVVQRAKAPVVVLNLQPRAALDYSRTDTGEWLANCSACCVPEISFAFARAGIAFHVVTGMLEPEPDVREPWQSAWKGIREWCEAAAAVRNLRRARIGFLGHVYPGMLDMYSDFTQHHAQTGAHIEVLEKIFLLQRFEDRAPVGKNRILQIDEFFHSVIEQKFYFVIARIFVRSLLEMVELLQLFRSTLKKISQSPAQVSLTFVLVFNPVL